jgi:hypothetical protein
VKSLVCCNAKIAVVRVATRAHIALQHDAGSNRRRSLSTGNAEEGSNEKKRGDLTMSSTTFNPAFAATTTADQGSSQPRSPAKSALWTKLYTNLIEARQAQADAIVARHMAVHDDRSLKAIGWTDDEIAAMRRRHGRAAR